MTEVDDLRQYRLAYVHEAAVKKGFVEHEDDIEATVLDLIARYEDQIDTIYDKQSQRVAAIGRVSFLLSYLSGDEEVALLDRNGWRPNSNVDRHASRIVGFFKDMMGLKTHDEHGVPLEYKFSEEEGRDLDDVVRTLAENDQISKGTAGQYLLLLGKAVPPEGTSDYVIERALQQAGEKMRIRLRGDDVKHFEDDKQKLGVFYLGLIAGQSFSTIRSIDYARVTAESEQKISYSLEDIETAIAHALEAMYPAR